MSESLLTDFYQLTMAYGYWKQKMDQRKGVFHLFFRRPPFAGGFTIACGLESAIEYLKNYRFTQDDLDYLAGLKGADGETLFEEGFLTHLSQLQFSCDVDAVPEGTVVFPNEPLLRVTGPLLQCQLLETPLLNLINFPSLIATKAARVTIAAAGDEVFEFGLRRAQGTNGAMAASRAAYVGGCTATSNVLAGKQFKIPVRGTHSHSWVMAFDDEEESFRAFAESLPGNCIFLVDTYNSIEGIKKAIRVGLQLREKGKELLGIRLDSGDLNYLSQEARKMLDAAGFEKVKIVASNELDETIITDLKRQGSKITVWGVGTHLVTAKDHPALDGVYKLSAIEDEKGKWQYRLKLSEQLRKVSTPGNLQVRRFFLNGEAIGDAIYDELHREKKQWEVVDPFDATRRKIMPTEVSEVDLLVPIFREGKLVYKCPSLEKVRDAREESLSHFHSGVKRFVNPHQYVVGMERGLFNLRDKIVREIRRI